MMTQGFYQSNAGAGFREYLTSSMSDMFSLDLSRCTLIECINKMCEIKSRSHPKIKQNYRMLVNKLEELERQIEQLMKMSAISDTVRDTIQVPVPVEKKLTKWQQTKVDWGGWAILVMIIVIVFLVIYPRWRLHKGRS